jgi:hypothetical protein
VRYPGFIGATYNSRSPIAAGTRTINWIVENVERDGKVARILVPSPGRLLWAYVGDGLACGGMCGTNGHLFSTFGQNLYEIWSDPNIAPSLVGFVGYGPHTLESNGTQLMIVGPQGSYLLDLSTSVLSHLDDDPDYPGAGMLAYSDGYFIINKPFTREWYISGYNNGLTWDPLDFGVKESDPGNILSVLVDHREVFLFGERKIEGWTNTGNADFPFERNNSAVIEQGIGAPRSAARVDNSLIWLGGDERGKGIFWRANGYTPIRCSDHSVEYAMTQYPYIYDAIAYAYQEAGHTFYVVNFPQAEATWALDLATGLWAERGYWDHENAVWKRDRAAFHCHIWGEALVGDFQHGAIYKQGIQYGDDAGAPIRRVRRGPHVFGEGGRVYIPGLEFHFEQGLGSIAGEDPRAMLRTSFDGGKTWGMERTASIGKIGEYSNRTIFKMIGSGQDFVAELAVDASTPVRLVDAFIK